MKRSKIPDAKLEIRHEPFDFSRDYRELRNMYPHYNYGIAFQLESLLRACLLLPDEVACLEPQVRHLVTFWGPGATNSQFTCCSNLAPTCLCVHTRPYPKVSTSKVSSTRRSRMEFQEKGPWVLASSPSIEPISHPLDSTSMVLHTSATIECCECIPITTNTSSKFPSLRKISHLCSMIGISEWKSSSLIVGDQYSAILNSTLEVMMIPMRIAQSGLIAPFKSQDGSSNFSVSLHPR